jgi:broad specificity phosphatase PhoE
MDFYIFRHGETYFSKLDIPYGDMIESAEILPEALPVIEKLAKYFQNIDTDTNFASPFVRCRQTVEIIEKIAGKKFVYEDKLKDWNLGKESLEKMILRIKDFYEKLMKKNYKSVAICTHGYPINALIALATKGEATNSDLYNYPRTGVLIIIKNKKKDYLDFNK